jgi:hypothetical protein
MWSSEERKLEVKVKSRFMDRIVCLPECLLEMVGFAGVSSGQVVGCIVLVRVGQFAHQAKE